MSVHAHPGTAWLRTVPRGALTLVDGVTGRVSAGLTLPGTAGHELQVSQQGNTILVYDPVTGVLTRINAGNLSAGTNRATVPGVALVAGANAAYLVDYGAATVQRIDLTSLNASGPTLRIGGQIGQAGVDAGGILWLPRIDTGQVIPVTGSGLGTPVTVAPGQSDLSVSIVGGKPVVVDGTHGKVSGVSGPGVTWSVALPQSSVQWVVPPTQDGSLLPLAGPGQHVLDLIDIGHHQVQSVPLGPEAPNHLGPPLANAGRVYVPDYDTGRVLVYNAGSGAWDPSFAVGDQQGPFDAVAKDGVVYFNDPNGPHTVVVTGDGVPTPLDKYTLPRQQPAAASPPVPGVDALPPAQNPVGSSGTGGIGLGNAGMSNTGGGGQSAGPYKGPSRGGTATPTVTRTPGVPWPTPTPSPTPTPTPTPSPTPTPTRTRPPDPGGTSATGQADGSIQVNWGAENGVSFVVTYSGPTSGRLRTQNTSITIPAGSLSYLGHYTITVYATNAAGTSPGATVTAVAGPRGKSFTADVRLTRTDPQNPCINLAVCRAQINTGPSHTSGVAGYAPQGATVTGYCHKSGQTIRNDLGQSSAEWIYTTSGYGTGYIPSMWLGGPSAYQAVPLCP